MLDNIFNPRSLHRHPAAPKCQLPARCLVRAGSLALVLPAAPAAVPHQLAAAWRCFAAEPQQPLPLLLLLLLHQWIAVPAPAWRHPASFRLHAPAAMAAAPPEPLHLSCRRLNRLPYRLQYRLLRLLPGVSCTADPARCSCRTPAADPLLPVACRRWGPQGR